jgi:hypothetical protein
MKRVIGAFEEVCTTIGHDVTILSIEGTDDDDDDSGARDLKAASDARSTLWLESKKIEQ